jgi:hypothetical protein
MLIRPDPESFGLTADSVKEIREAGWNRDSTVFKLTLVAGACLFTTGAVWFYLTRPQDEIAGVLTLYTLVAVTVGWMISMGISYTLISRLVPYPSGWDKAKAYEQSQIDFERQWREKYLAALWDGLALRSYHAEPQWEGHNTILGFREYWKICHPSLLFMLSGKRHVMSLVNKPAPLEEREAHAALNTLGFYEADVMTLVAPNGVSQRALEYLIKHQDKIKIETGDEAMKTQQRIQLFRNPPSSPTIPADLIMMYGRMNELMNLWKAIEPGTGGDRHGMV